MALEAKRHAQRLGMIYLHHLVDLTMAMNATDSAVHMDRMVEVNVIRNLMDLHPLNRLARGRTLANGREPRVFLEHLIVAIHAHLARRNIGIPTLLHRAVTVT